jgi:CubicO group peptidase (beta-lactamase class C family)
MKQPFDRRAFVGAGALAAAGLTGGASFARELEKRADNVAASRIHALPSIPGAPAASPESVGVAPDITARINAFMQHEVDAGRQSGGVTAVARRGKLIHFASHGHLDIEAGTPMTDDRLFQMMSSTKPVTAVALLQQIETGKVSLDDKVSRFIPELKEMRVSLGGEASTPGKPVETVPADREITIKDLATHTSGLDGFLLAIPHGTPNTLEARIPYARTLPLDFQPGARWSYSAVTGPDILARVVEITSGLTWDRYLKERIFEPVGMRDTGFNLTDEQRARVVPRYTRQGETWHREADDIPLAVALLARTGGANPKTTYFPGSFGLYSTARDYLLFETMLLNKGTIHGKRVLRPESVALMSSNLVGGLYTGHGAYPNPVQGTGFGILVRTVLDPATCGCGRKAGAFGWAGAYGTTSWTDPANELVAVFMVQQRVDPTEVEFERLIAGALTA